MQYAVQIAGGPELRVKDFSRGPDSEIRFSYRGQGFCFDTLSIDFPLIVTTYEKPRLRREPSQKWLRVMREYLFNSRMLESRGITL